jgi:hypothetical protein
MSVTGWLQAVCVKFPTQLDRLVVKHFYSQKNTNRNSKLRSKRCHCKRKEQDTSFYSVLREEDSPWQSGDVWTNLVLYLFTLHIPLSFGGFSVVAFFTGQQPLLHPQTQVTSPLSFILILLVILLG